METIKLKVLGQTVTAETLSQQLTAVEAIEYMKLKFTDTDTTSEDILVRELLRGYVDASTMLKDGTSRVYNIYEVYSPETNHFLLFAHLNDYTV